MTTPRRFDAIFWIAIAVLLTGTMSCFGYAGIQLNPAGATARHAIDAIAPKLRSPISFERSTPRSAPISQSTVEPLADVCAIASEPPR